MGIPEQCVRGVCPPGPWEYFWSFPLSSLTIPLNPAAPLGQQFEVCLLGRGEQNTPKMFLKAIKIELTKQLVMQMSFGDCNPRL